MKFKFLAAAVLSSAAMVSTSVSAYDVVELDAETLSSEQMVSYAFGYQLGMQLQSQFHGEVDFDLVEAAIADALAGNQPQLPQDAVSAAYQEMMAAKQAIEDAAAESRLADNAKYLEDNAKRDGVVVTDSGLQYEIVESSGSGKKPAATDSVKVHYTGKLLDGTVFDSSVERGTPATFGVNQVIQGWVEGLQLMDEGDKYKFFIPSELAYGAQSTGSIPANSVLVFDVELIEIVAAE